MNKVILKIKGVTVGMSQGYDWYGNEYDTPPANQVVCRNKECKHLLVKTSFCNNPDCFYHKHYQTEEEPRWNFHD